MGFSWIRLDGAGVLEDTVIVRMVASDDDSEDTPDEEGRACAPRSTLPRAAFDPSLDGGRLRLGAPRRKLVEVLTQVLNLFVPVVDGCAHQVPD